MPAMSPTMSEGGISKWKVSEGSPFSTGEVLLEIETDKATIDVEAQEDGIMGKIIAGDGAKNVQVGQLIALLAEEGDDISSLEVPKGSEASSKPAEKSDSQAPSTSASSSSTSPSASSSSTTEAKQSQSQPIKIDHSKPIFPSVMRLLQENGISPDKVKGTGIRGMLTKGDVLAFMGKASTPTGTWKVVDPSPIPKSIHKPAPKDMTPDEVKRLMVEGMVELSRKQHPAPSRPPVTYESIIAGYIPPQSISASSLPTPIPTQKSASAGYLDGLI